MYRQNKRLWFFTLLSLGLCFTQVCDVLGEKKKPSLSWRETSESLALMNGDQVVWQFNHLQEGKEKGCPYFHPLATLDGAVLTDLRPGDHLWHRGLRFAWKKINGLEGYWVWPDGQKRWPDKKMGRTEVTEVKVIANDDFSATFELQLSYHPPGEPADLIEKRTISVSAPDEKGDYHIDWHGVFTAGAKGAVLDRTPIEGEQDGKWFGGYAGLQFRVADLEKVTSWTISNSGDEHVRSDAKNITKETRESLAVMHGKAANWVDLYLEWNDDKHAGVMIMDHPSNFHHPSPWHVAAMPHEFHQAPIFDAPVALKAGDKISFTFRILIHADRREKREIDQSWEQFSKLYGKRE
ncbi:MAG: PmoA family protein [Verrucomicrobiales bacterium]|nr:PmoA family protein [Verrucomicrobiales bacterium]